MRNDGTGKPLVPGVSVDIVDIEAGMAMAAQLGYTSPTDQMITHYALRRHARGEEDGAQRTWLSYHTRDLTSWYAILAAATCEGAQETAARAEIVQALKGSD